jgi:hypothetical protein
MTSPSTILDDALSPSIFAKVKDTIRRRDFLWNFSPFPVVVHSGEGIDSDLMDNHCFSHRAKVYAPNLHELDRKKFDSEYADLFESCLLLALDKMNLRIKTLHKINVGFVIPSPGGVSVINPPHVDIVRPHQVGLLYINDSDGDTVIYNEKFDFAWLHHRDTRDSIYYYNNVLRRKVTTCETITPKENRFAMFDGMHYHSSTSPLGSKRRIAINYNFETL